MIKLIQKHTFVITATNKVKKCVDQIVAVRKSASELLIMASKLTALSLTIPPCRKRLASTRDNPTVSKAVVQSGGSESVGKVTSLSQNGVNNLLVGGTPSRMPPAPPVNASSNA